MYKIDNIQITEKQLDELIAQREERKAIKYPIFKKSKYNGAIVKFKSLKSTTVVWEGDGNYKIGHKATDFIEHTNINTWEDVVYDSERNLWDGQPVYCWNSYCTHSRVIKFYDAKNKRAFTYHGKRNGLYYHNHEAIEPQHYTKWTIEEYKTLEGI